MSDEPPAQFKNCSACRALKPLSDFYSRQGKDGSTYHFPKCKACYALADRRSKAKERERLAELRRAQEPPPLPPPEPIPLSERIARVQRDAQELTWILRRYMLRNRSGVCYLRLRPNENDPKRRAVALAVERLVTGIWDAALANTALGFRPVDPRTNREMLARG